ncbi:hypothetical protein QO004_005945 [Rhizobium mesoamericanum]|uniref:hypothetical protein n=1 Tax=Rhizobium mesoamericanum TaxID=1079800 RepID=UPI0027897D36|nr:hypothetical protein [Rhizobium mesoamericanum]MDQ0564127.1 hypothetical protein [Rhizobium mesoamericanum]
MTEIYRIETVFSPIIHQPAWQVHVGHGSFLTFEFGNPSLERTEPIGSKRRRIRIRGDWHLWIYCCSWQITANGEILATNEDTNEKMSKAAHFLDGQILVDVSPSGEEGKSRFEFDLGGTLETWPDATDPADQWMLYHGHDVWTLGADGKITLTDIDKTPAG